MNFVKEYFFLILLGYKNRKETKCNFIYNFNANIILHYCNIHIFAADARDLRFKKNA